MSPSVFATLHASPYDRDSFRIQPDALDMEPRMTYITINHDHVFYVSFALLAVDGFPWRILLLHDKAQRGGEQVLHAVAATKQEQIRIGRWEEEGGLATACMKFIGVSSIG